MCIYLSIMLFALNVVDRRIAGVMLDLIAYETCKMVTISNTSNDLNKFSVRVATATTEEMKVNCNWRFSHFI